MSHFMEGKLKKISVDRWWRVNDVIIESVEALETRYSIILNGSDVIFQKNKKTKNNNKPTTTKKQSLCPCQLTRPSQ